MAIITFGAHSDHIGHFVGTRRSAMATIVHQPRVAWDGARAFVFAAGSPDAEDFANKVQSRLGREAYIQFFDTQYHLFVGLLETGGDRYASDVEAGKWRVRLEDLLRNRPELIDDVRHLTAVALDL
jgi:hypothetical protein